ncbi:MAG TPA: hypothetical protein VFY06_11730, partial [Verrucomicrobiae bacterium]|nr:hypothetical protein [Verrucomicrobiae bacterium]
MNKRITQFGSGLWRWTAFWRSGPGLTILAVTLVGLRWLWIQVQRPAHVAENAAAYGSLRTIYGPARMNHDGSRFIYVATAEDRGRALVLCDALTGKKRQLTEDTQGVGTWKDDFNIQAGPWSPDDSCFLCCVSNRLMICPADTSQESAVIDTGPFSEAVWLTPTQFAYVTGGTNLCVAQKRADGRWDRKIITIQPVPLTSLTAVGSNAV